MAVGVNARTAFSLLFPPILTEFGWDRGVVAGVFSFGFFVSAFLSPFVGRLMDRKGPRFVVEIGAILLAIGLALAPLSREPWQLYLTLGMLVGAGGNLLGYGVQSQFIPNWFVRRRGLAIGIAFSGVGIGSIVLLPWLQHVISRDGWRSACWLLALITIVVVVPLNLLLRRRPQEIGLNPDGDAAPDAPASGKHARNIVDPAWAVDRMDACARAAHRAVLVDRARLWRGTLRLVCGADPSDQVPDRDRRLGDGGRVGARSGQPARRARADHLRPCVGPDRARVGLGDRLRGLRHLLPGADRPAGRTHPAAALRHGAGAGLPRLFDDLGARPDRRRDLRRPAFRHDLRQRDAGGDRRRRGRSVAHRACSTTSPATTSARSGSRRGSPWSRPAPCSSPRRARCGGSRGGCRNDFGAGISARSGGKAVIRLGLPQ